MNFNVRSIKCLSLFLMCILFLWPLSAFSENVPFNIGTKILTLKNGIGLDTLEFENNENVTVQFTDSEAQKNKNKVELTISNFNGSTQFLKKKVMTEVENDDGSFTYYHTFNTLSLLSGDPDWYYYKIETKTPKGDLRGHFSIKGSTDNHHFKIYKDAYYKEEANVFGSNDIVYIEVIGEDNGENISTKKITITDFEKQKYINSNISLLEQNGNSYRFSVDLSLTKKTFLPDTWYSVETEISQKKGKNTSFLGYREIKVLVDTVTPAKKWFQLDWREVQ